VSHRFGPALSHHNDINSLYTYMAGVEGLEPPTPGFGDRCSSRLSYTPTRPRCCEADAASPWFEQTFKPRRWRCALAAVLSARQTQPPQVTCFIAGPSRLSSTEQSSGGNITK
jgi:hypothetical protein